jgi:hypothetical protein
MSVSLRLTAVLCLAWALLLLVLKGRLVPAAELTALAVAAANALGIANLVFACLFWYAAGEPAAHRAAVYAAIMLAALKTANDLYELLVLMPPHAALLTLADLVLSVALLVGLLEALPRMVARARGKDL